MARQILTFFVIFVVISVLMRSCAPQPTLDAEPPTQTVAIPSEAEVLTLTSPDKSTTVILDRDGTLVEARVDAKATFYVRPVASYSRAFSLLFLDADGRRTNLTRAGWKSAKIEGGYEFVHETGEQKVVKRIRWNEDATGLVCEVDASGIPDSMVRIWMTAASGVPLGRGDTLVRSGAVWQVDEEKLSLRGFARMLEAREQERSGRIRRMKEDDENVPDRLPYAERRELAAGMRMARLGIAGEKTAVTLAAADGTEVSQVYADVFRANRDGESSNEIETWMDLNLRDNGYRGSFSLEWAPVDTLGLKKEQAPAQLKTLENETMRVVVSDRGAAIKEIWLKRFTESADEPLTEENWIPVVRGTVRPGQRTLTMLSDDDRYGIDIARAPWDANEVDGGVRFTLKTPNGWELRKTILLPEGEDAYALPVTIEAIAPQGSSASRAAFQLVGPAGTYVADAYRGIIGADPPAGVLIEHSGGDNQDLLIDDFKKGDELQANYSGSREGLLAAVAVRGSYFVVALAPSKQQDAAGSLRGNVSNAALRGIKLEEPVTRADGEASSDSIQGYVSCSLPLDGGTAKETFTLYAGPNRLDDLRPVHLEETVDFGMFGFIGRGLMWLMKTLQGLFGSYGIAIMFMTLIVRALLMPISYRTQLGMQRYAKRLNKIKPILEDLDKKYGKNPQKLNQEKMKVMREHGVGLPLGCLTMFLQIPIWFALFQALRVEFAIRHQPFLWAHDLSMPDRLFSLPFFPGEFNLFPILMLVLWVTQQKLAPQTGSKSDPQVQMQMKMMKFMPFMFFLFLYKYIAALSIYMCVSSAWSIVESRLVKKAIARLD